MLDILFLEFSFRIRSRLILFLNVVFESWKGKTLYWTEPSAAEEPTLSCRFEVGAVR
jgi:hypothetical protein